MEISGSLQMFKIPPIFCVCKSVILEFSKESIAVFIIHLNAECVCNVCLLLLPRDIPHKIKVLFIVIPDTIK
jgi:hypothetical protein